MFQRLATFISRHWLLVLICWVVIPVGIKLLAPSWDDVCRDGDFAYLPARMTSARGEKLIGEAFPDLASKSEIVVLVARPGGKLREEDREIASRLAEKFAPHEGVASPVAAVWSCDEPLVGQKLISPLGPNGQAVLVILQLNTELMEIANIPFVFEVHKAIEDMQKEAGYPEGLQVGVTGSAAIGTDMLCSADQSIRNTEWVTISLVVLILLIVYRAPGLVIVPLLAIAASFIVSTDVLAILAHGSETSGWFDFQIFKTTKIFIVVILFGAATDYCLFLIARYREELQRGLDPAAALEESLAQTGHALTGSAMTTILGLGAMLFADFGKYRSGGPTIALSLVVALVACVTLAPALLRAFGRSVFWPFGVGQDKPSPVRVFSGEAAVRPSFMGRFWERIAQGIITRPGLILVCSFLILALPAYCGLSVPVTYDMLGELNSDCASVQGARLLEKFFPIGETGPITVLASHPGGNFDGKDERRQVSMLTKELCERTYTDTNGVEGHPILGVRSLTNPLGGPPGAFSPFTPAGRRRMAAVNHPRTKATFLSSMPGYAGAVTRFDLICRYDPFSHEAVRLLDQIEQRLLAHGNDAASPWHGTSFDFIGITAGIRDLEAVNTSDTYRIGLLVSLAVFGVLVFLLRRPVISCYLIFTVLFGYFATLGITKLFFAWLFGDTFQGLDWKLPIFLFVILVAVGEDYNIYLVTRVFEEQRRRGLIEGLRYAVVRTGGIITSCGVIMAGTFGSMITGTLRGMYELGFSLALGVLLDTFIIRTILVPSFLALWARWFGEPAQEGDAKVVAPHFESVLDAEDRPKQHKAGQLVG